MLLRIQATAATLTADEIKKAIPPETLQQIKKNNPHPYFQAYSIAQEGESRPREVGSSQNSLILWPRKAIQSIGSALKKGLQFFKQHNADNSTEGRPSLGEFVGRIGKEIGGRLHEIVVGYFPDKQAAMECDICSIEADVIGSNVSPGAFVVDAIESITGIALDNSSHDAPAFAGAKRLASLQFFGGDDDPSDKNKTKGAGTPAGGNPMTFEEVKAAAMRMNIHPSQLYTIDQIRKDREFAPVFDQRDSLEAELKELKEAREADKEKYANLEKDIQRNDAKNRINTFIPAEATDGQKKLIEKRIASKLDKLDDLTDDGLKSFVNDAIEDYNELSGVINPDGSGSGDGNAGAGQGDDNHDDPDKSAVDEAFEDAMSK